MYRLPVRTTLVQIRQPNGADDVFLNEAQSLDRMLALQWMGRLVPSPDLAELVVHDFEALLLHLRRMQFGDRVQADAQCHCGERVDIEFRLSAYLAGRVPRRPPWVTESKEAGWFGLVESDVKFRLPTITDQLEVAHAGDPETALAERCLRPAKSNPEIESAMEALAPPLSDDVIGECPNCQQTVTLHFDVPSFVLHEHRVQASSIYEDVHLLARHYHWSEDQILALPARRRQAYVERLRAEQVYN